MARKGRRQVLKGGDEYDALTKARRFYCYLTKAGVVKSIKRKANKRWRRDQKEKLRKELQNGEK